MCVCVCVCVCARVCGSVPALNNLSPVLPQNLNYSMIILFRFMPMNPPSRDKSHIVRVRDTEAFQICRPLPNFNRIPQTPTC